MLRLVLAVLLIPVLARCSSAPPSLERFNSPQRHSCVSGISAAPSAWLNQSSADFQNTNLYEIRRSGSRWSDPSPLPFSAGTESGGSLSRDGRWLLFTSRREAAPFSDRWNLWSAERNGDQWSAAQPLPAPLNSSAAECCAVVGPAGEIYFSSTRHGSWDIYVGRPRGGGYEVERLGQEINSGEAGPPDESGRNGEWPSYVDPRGRFILFSSIRRGGVGGDDLYLSWNRGGRWTPAVNLGGTINTAGYEDCASVSADGRTLIWSSRTTEPGATSQIRTAPLRSLEIFRR